MTHPRFAVAFFALCSLGSTECAPPDDLAASASTELDAPAGRTSDAEPSACAPVEALACGTSTRGDTASRGGGATSAIDNYPAAVGNFSGPELTYSLVGDGGPVTLRFVDPDPTELDQDIFVLEDDDGRCDPARAFARGHNRVEFVAEAGVTYYVVVDGFDGDEGAFTLDVECATEGPSAPGDCSDYTSDEPEGAPVQTTGDALPPSAEALPWQPPTAFTRRVDFQGTTGEPATHEGIDWIHDDPSVPVVRVGAAAPGTVAYVRLGCRQSDLFERNLDGRECGAGWGDHVVLDHGDGVFTRYAHLDPGTVAVRVGDAVDAGTTLGAMGNSGRSEVRHLHFELGTSARGFDSCAAAQSFDEVISPSRVGL